MIDPFTGRHTAMFTEKQSLDSADPFRKGAQEEHNSVNLPFVCSKMNFPSPVQSVFVFCFPVSSKWKTEVPQVFHHIAQGRFY